MDDKKENSLAGFLKKRAPIYLGLTGLFLIFAVPQFMGTSLDDMFPEMTGTDEEILDILMMYDGPNEKGLTVLQALDMKIKERFDDKIYNDKSSKVIINITGTDEKSYDVAFSFITDEEDLLYIWTIHTETDEIEGKNTNAKGIIDLVDFYD